MVRAGLEAILRGSGDVEVVGAVPGLAGAADHIETLHPDVIVAAPEGEASGPLPLSTEGGLPGLVLLTNDPEHIEALDALRQGGRAVLPRDSQPQEILAAVRAVGAGLVVLHVDSAAPLLPHLNGIAPAPRVPAGENLTPREIEVLTMLAEGAGNKQIARRLGISEHTVKFHVGSIMAKLDASSRTEAVTAGIRGGLILL